MSLAPYHLAYRAQQASLRYPLVVAHQVVRALTHHHVRPAGPSLRAMQRRYRELLTKDLRNVDAGLYPKELLFRIPFGEYAKTVPKLLWDLPRAYSRSKRRDFRDLPADVDLTEYPHYFRRTFHWQTDGYLSRQSAELYDLGVEMLFMGCADIMRRQVIPPMVHYARRNGGKLRILDVACGTGRTLGQVARALPGNKYFGVDLSPFYVDAAREHLAETHEVSLLAENAEALPYRDGYFDIVSSVYLMHELPRNARRNVVEEMHRVLKPGGLAVVEDSAQLTDAEEIGFFLENFASEMHEPFYADYLRDDLAELLGDAGFEAPATEDCWVAKVVSACRPAA